jgi:hypothetical protein
MKQYVPSRLLCALALAALTTYGSKAMAADADPIAAAWLGNEIAIVASEQSDHVPQGGRLTLIYDSADDVYRLCTRPVPSQRAAWRGDWQVPCAVALTLTKGTRYCTRKEVDAGNAEVLAACHRLRSREVVMHPSPNANGGELHDVMVFLIEPVPPKRKGGIAILLDSPARVTHAGHIHGDPP